MAEFLRAKTSTFTNKPMGVIDTRTGGAEVGKAIANLGNNITEMAFKDAVKDQEKLGKDTVLQMPVRDENNDLVIAELPTNLSSVARETAEPLLQRKMADAIYMDTQLGLANIRKSAKNEAEYSEKANVYLEQVEMRLSETGGDAYIQEARNAFGKVSSQHSIDLMIKDGKRENEIALTNHYGVVDQSIASIKLQFATNDPSAQTDFDLTKAKILSTTNSFMDVNPTGVSKALDQLEVAKAEGIIRRVTNNASSDDYMKIQKAVLDGGMSLKNVPKEYRESVKEAIKTLDKDLLDDLDAALEPFRIDQTNSENKAKSLFNQGKPVRQLQASREIDTFSNEMITNLANGNISFEEASKSLAAKLISNDQQVGLIGEPHVRRNRLVLLDGYVRGVTNNMAQTVDDINAEDINNVIQAITTNNSELEALRPELRPYVKTILDGTPDNLNDKIAGSFSRLRQTLNMQDIKRKAIEGEMVYGNRLTQGLESNSAKSMKAVDNIILNGKSQDYFNSRQSLGDPQLDFFLKKGNLPLSVVTQMEKLASGSLTGEAFDVALQRYMSISSKLNKNSGKFQDYFSTIHNGLSAGDNAKLKAAVNIAEIKGFENFNEILGDITNMETEEGTRAVNLKARQIFEDKSIETYLRGEITDHNVIREMKPYVQYLIHGGVDVDKIKENVKNFIDTKFLETKGIVADPLGPANKSLYALDAIIPDADLQNEFLTLIKAELPDGYNFGVTVGRENLGLLRFMPGAQEVASQGDTSVNQERVYLVPQPISPTNISGGRTGEVLYHVMYVDKSDMLSPLIKDGISLTFSTKEVTQKIVDKENNDALQLEEDRLKDDILSSDIAQSNINADIIKNNNTPSLGKRLMDVD